MSYFDWDKFAENATWDEIRTCSPVLSSHRLPSMRTRDFIYLSSLDLDYRVSDQDSLLKILPLLIESFKTHLQRRDYYKASVAESDWFMIDSILYESGTLNPTNPPFLDSSCLT